MNGLFVRESAFHGKQIQDCQERTACYKLSALKSRAHFPLDVGRQIGLDVESLVVKDCTTGTLSQLPLSSDAASVGLVLKLHAHAHDENPKWRVTHGGRSSADLLSEGLRVSDGLWRAGLQCMNISVDHLALCTPGLAGFSVESWRLKPAHILLETVVSAALRLASKG